VKSARFEQNSEGTPFFDLVFQMAGMKLLSITNITIVIFIIYLSYTANTFYAMFRPPTCKSNNCLSPHFKPSANKKLKVNQRKIRGIIRQVRFLDIQLPIDQFQSTTFHERF
jgi:predicted tellurium resistance membrane protein TerC